MKPIHSAPSLLTLGLCLMAGFAFVGFALAAHAAVPGEVSYQGLLLDDLGDPITASVAMEFELFDADTLGNSLWFESHPAVQVVDGVYDVVLGSTTPISQAIVAGGAVHLEVSIDGETLSPRQQLLVVPYALRAEVAETADQAASLGAYEAAYFAGLLEHVNLDGQEPGNTDPAEGTADVDGDGVPNFVDDDNDDDGLLDGAEVLQGSDINLITPTLIGFDPLFAYGNGASNIEVQGTSLSTVASVSFGPQNPVPSGVSDTAFDVTLAPQPESIVAVTVTLSNGESVASNYYFRTKRTIFATSTEHSGNLGGLAGADAICQARADEAGLYGNYQAWLSNGIDSPSTRESQLGDPYEDTTGVTIANDWADLTDGSIDAGIERDETGALVAGVAWTNVAANGAGNASSTHCLGWTAGAPQGGQRGSLGATNSLWSLMAGGQSCGVNARLYCVEQ